MASGCGGSTLPAFGSTSMAATGGSPALSVFGSISVTGPSVFGSAPLEAARSDASSVLVSTVAGVPSEELSGATATLGDSTALAESGLSPDMLAVLIATRAVLLSRREPNDGSEAKLRACGGTSLLASANDVADDGNCASGSGLAREPADRPQTPTWAIR